MTDDESPPEQEWFDMEVALEEIFALRAQMKDAEAKIDKLTQQVVEAAGTDENLVFLGPDGSKRTATIVRGNTTVIDVVGLRDELSPGVFDQLIDVKIRPVVLEEAINRGLVKGHVAARHVKYVPKKPYVKF